jgi:hypothetical protein
MDQAIERCRSVLAPNELLELEAGRSLLLLWWRGEEAAVDDIARIKTTYAGEARLDVAVRWVERRSTSASGRTQ